MATLVSPTRPLVLPARCLVGRSRDCDLVVRARDVSAHHATLEHDGADWVLRDLGSRNGTWLDGERLTVGLYITIHRARTQLGELGVADAAGLVERRLGTRQLRIGVGRLEVVPLPGS